MSCFLNFEDTISVGEVVGSTIDSFLGPNKSYKMVIDDNETHLVKCPLSLFQHVHLKNPLSNLIEETLYAHHEIYGCSSTTLLAMWYFWSKTFKALIEEGCEVDKITEASSRILELVISSLETVEIPMERVLSVINSAFPKSRLPSSNCSNVDTIELSSCTDSTGLDSSRSISRTKIPKGILYSSRHYSPFKYHLENSEQDGDVISKSTGEILTNQPVEDTEAICFSKEAVNEIHCVAKKFCHDDAEMEDIISELWIQQMVSTKSTRFCTSYVITCPIIMPSTYTKVVSGLVWKTNSNNFIWKNLSASRIGSNVLIIKGDITYEYVHLGFTPKTAVKNIKSSEQMLQIEKELWLKECSEVLVKLNISLLLVKGKTDTSIIDFCALHNIRVFNDVPWNILQLLCNSANQTPATHLRHCDSRNIMSGISVKKFEIVETTSMRNNDNYYFKIETSHIKDFQSVIMCHPSPPLLNLKEHQFWHSASRLSLATESTSVLPGTGITEKWCFDVLEDLAAISASESSIILAMANGFLQYSNAIFNKMKLCDHIGSALDEKKSKVQAWQSAMSLMLMTIQCDAVIINGCDEIIVEDMKNCNNFIGIL